MKKIKYILAILCIATVVNINAGASLNSIVDFYGHSLYMTHDQHLGALRFSSLSQKEITENLHRYRNSPLRESMEHIQRHQRKYALDDAGTVILVNKYANDIAQQAYSNKATFIKYLMLKSLGYDVILTRTGKRLNCLGNLTFAPGRFIYIKYANKVYKDLNFTNRKNHGQHLIYRDDIISKKAIGHQPNKAPRINALLKSKSIHFEFGVEKHELTATSNQSLINYLSDLPMYKVGREFTNIRMSEQMEASTVQYLRDQVADRDTIDAVRFILAFVQQVTAYGSDYDKYGEEQFYYPEQTVMATTADCEDKAMLMAYLSREILGLETIGLFFQADEHISMAIHIPNYTPYGSFKYAGKVYVSCEPTAKYPKLTQSQFSLNRVTEVIPL